jgi:glucose/arabinose dehydrogenase
MRPRVLVSMLVAAGVLAAASPALAASLQPIGNFPAPFIRPTYVTSLPDPNKLLIVERQGTIQLWDGVGASTFLDIRDRVAENPPDGELGMFSVAVDPDYATTGHIYVFYTDNTDDLVIDEYTASGSFAPASTRRNVLTIEHTGSKDHNGGQLQFGPDGYLYLSTGDGESASGVFDVDAQNAGSLLGKILRIDPRPSGSAPYSVPPGNPFSNEVWALGLRNPWRFSFDAAMGDLLIADVGETNWEEVDYAPAGSGAGRGLNFGWNCFEGTHLFPGEGCVSRAGVSLPIFEYETPEGGDRCAIMGGYVVRDPSLPDLYGRYLYGDFCSGEIRSIALPGGTGDRSEGLQVPLVQSFGQDSCARIYVASAVGSVYRLVGDAPTQCQVASAPAPPSAPSCAGQPATRTAARNGSAIGTSGPDVLVGDERRNKIRGKGGNDLICARAGADRIKGGPGRDKIRAGPGRDRCSGGPGKDRERSCLKR